MSTFVTVKEKTLARCRKMGSTILIRYLCTRKFGVLYAANDKQKEIYGY